jgi:glyoxylase-like metal-dependent hydrolase (beta-lactamase superfamily II)
MSTEKIKLYVMDVGRINLPSKSHITPGSGMNEPISMPAYCYLIEHPKGLVLVDTGMTDGGPCTVNDDQVVYNQLAVLGHKPDDVKYVVMTHLHVDHAGYMAAFPKSTFVVRKEELRAAWWPEKCEGGYVFDQYKDTRNFDYIQPDDDVDFDLFCDGTVLLIDTKGHTRGHQSLIVTLENAGKIVLVSDAASLRENLDSMILPGVSSNNWFAMQSLDKIRHLEMGGYTLFFGHDVEQRKALKLLPNYYD